ncbi:hypothetical protein [Ilyobacter sp.]|uniref:hypothetical protein n=1 Tax=Ilyobacter sp. TaxID=3100343 RepID=UPI00356387DB
MNKKEEVKKSTTAEDEKLSERAVKKNKVDKIKRRIYIGPSAIKFGISKDAVFKGEVPKVYEEFFEKYPLAQKLVVELEKLTECKVKLAQKGSAEQVMYEKIERQMRGGN